MSVALRSRQLFYDIASLLDLFCSLPCLIIWIYQIRFQRQYFELVCVLDFGSDCKHQICKQRVLKNRVGPYNMLIAEPNFPKHGISERIFHRTQQQ